MKEILASLSGILTILMGIVNPAPSVNLGRQVQPSQAATTTVPVILDAGGISYVTSTRIGTISSSTFQLGAGISISSTGTISNTGLLTDPGWITTSTNLGINNFATTSVGQWVNNGLYLTTSTGLGISNFSSANISQWTNDLNYLTTSTNLGVSNFTSANLSLWTNNLNWVQSSSLSAYLTTSTGLGVSNFASANISQWTNNGLYLTTSTGLGIGNFTSANLSLWTNDLGWITTSTYNALGGTCGGTDKISAISATGTAICTADEGGTGGSGTVTTSTAVSADYFPFWNSNDGTGLNGTSTLFRSGLALFTGSTFNASGTISQNGVPVLTTSTGLGVSNFASANISQWTNNSNYVVNTRAINTDQGLQGGGDLSADRTLSINTSTALTWSALTTFLTGGVSSTQIWSASTTLRGITNASIYANGGGKLTAQVSQACSGTDKVSAVSATGTVTCATDQTGAGGATSTKTIPIVIDKIYTNQTAARNTWGNSAINYMFADFIGKTPCRTVVQVTVVGAGQSSVQVQFATSSQITWFQLDGSSATGATSTSVGKVKINIANASSSPWVVTSANFRNGSYLRISAWDGNAAADPAISAFVECF